MSGVVIEPVTSVDAIERNLARLNEAIVQLQGKTMALEDIEGYENLANKQFVEKEVTGIKDQCQFATGDILISESSTNPKEKLGYGEWKQVGEGKMLVGLGAGSGSVALATSDDSPLEPYPVYFWRRES